jgi:hypothetical protein
MDGVSTIAVDEKSGNAVRESREVLMATSVVMTGIDEPQILNQSKLPKFQVDRRAVGQRATRKIQQAAADESTHC